MNKPETKEIAPVPVPDVKEERAAMKAARAAADKVADACYAVLDCIRVANEDGSGKTFEQIKTETKLSEEELNAALDQLSSQLLIECSVAREMLVYHCCPGVPATPPIVIPLPPLVLGPPEVTPATAGREGARDAR